MEKKRIVIRASLQGMIGKLLGYSVSLLALLVFWQRIRRYQKHIFETYDVGLISALTDAMETDISVAEIGGLALSYILSLMVLFFLLYMLYRFLSLLLELTSTTIIDFEQQRIYEQRLHLPFHRTEDENIFHQIIQVRVEQNLIDRLVNGGAIYMEYLVLSRLDSQLRFLEVPYIKNPESIKRKLI